MDPITIIAFIIILSVLIFVHELGHFVVAKRAGITVEEFAIGFPPRAIKVWQDEGEITLDGQTYVIGRKMTVPRPIQPGSQVYAETSRDDQGRPVITAIELAPQDDEESPKQRVDSEARFFNMFDGGTSGPTLADGERPTFNVDTLVRPTEYSINWIPLGGYVRMVGEEDPTDPGSFASKSKKIRFAVLVAGSLMNLVAAVVFFALSSMSGVPQTEIGTFVTDVVPGAPADEAGIMVGDVIVGAADGAEFRYDGDLINYIETRKGQEVSLRLERDGEILKTSLTPRVNPPENQGSMGVAIRYRPIADTIIEAVEPDSPAATAGLQAGDVVVGAEGAQFKYADDLFDYITEQPSDEIVLSIDRDGQMLQMPLGLAAEPLTEDLTISGAKIDQKFQTTTTYYPAQTAILRGFSQTAEYVGLTFYVPVAILQNIFPAELARPTGPVGIYQQTGSAVEAAISLDWWFPVLWLTAVLSTALAVTNLLPLPALDGGRIFFIIVEAIRGKRIAPEKEGAIHFIGLALLMTLMLVITYYDVINPIPTIDWRNLF